MKKILVIIMTLFLFLSLIISSILVGNIRIKNKNLEKRINNIDVTIEKEKAIKDENSAVLNSLEQNENFKVDELSIWKKMEEKLSNALK